MLEKLKAHTPGGLGAVRHSTTMRVGELITMLQIQRLHRTAKKLSLVEPIHMHKDGAITPQ
jgi:hypothetical protein